MKDREIQPKRRSMNRIVIVFYSLLMGATQSPPWLQASDSVFEVRLNKLGIATDPKTLTDFLRAFAPTNLDRSEIGRRVLQLGDDQFEVRQKATQFLLKSPLPVELYLQKAIKESADQEVRHRARMILAKRTDSDQLLLVLKVISAKRIPGIIGELLLVAPFCKTAEQRHALNLAVSSCAKPTDNTLLKAGLTHQEPDTRIAAAIGFAACTAGQHSDLEKLLADDADQVKVTACRLLCMNKSRKGLPVLCDLLRSENKLVRVLAANTLRQATGEFFGFVGYGNQRDQKQAIEKWKMWVSRNALTAKLNFDLIRQLAPGGKLNGHTLLAYGNTNNKVVEFDLDGQEVWSYPATTPRAAEKLSNGNILISELTNNRVIEINLKGELVWQAKVNSPLTVYPLTNGNILVAQFENPSQVVEINRDGEVVWRVPIEGNCCSAFPLKNGNTLIAAYGKSVFELTRSGQTTWEYAATQSHGSRMVADGNILIAIQPTGRVLEVNRKKEIVWECRHHGAVDAFRLGNGNTLISGHSQTIEMTRDKKIVWAHGGCQYGTARR